MLSIVTVAFLNANVALSAAAPDCPPPLRPPQTNSQPLDKFADQVEAASRAQNHELCAGNKSQASDKQQSALLGLIRDRAAKRIRTLDASIRKLDPASTAEKVKQMRLLLAMQNARVDLSGGKLAITPAIQFAHPGGFGTLEPLTPEENNAIQRGIAESLRAYNAKMPPPGTPTAESMRRTSSLGTSLGGKIHEMGQVGYNDLIAQYPFLLFVNQRQPSPSHILGAQDRYGIAVANEARNIESLGTTPPEGKALGLIFYGPVVSEILNNEPGLCAAYNALKAQVRSTDSFRSLLNTGFGLASGGTCIAAAAVSAGILGAGCLLLAGAEFLVAAQTAQQAYAEKQVLYSGVLQGASFDEYDKKRVEATAYLAATGLSGLGAIGSIASAAARVPKLKAPVTGKGAGDAQAPKVFTQQESKPALQPKPKAGSEDLLGTGSLPPARENYSKTFRIDRASCPECPGEIHTIDSRAAHLSEHVIEDKPGTPATLGDQNASRSLYDLVQRIAENKNAPRKLADLMPELNELAKRSRPGKSTSIWSRTQQEKFISALKANESRPKNFRLTENGRAYVEVESDGNRVAIVYCHTEPCHDGLGPLKQGDIVTIYPVCGPDIVVLPSAHTFGEILSIISNFQNGEQGDLNKKRRQDLPRIRPCQ